MGDNFWALITLTVCLIIGELCWRVKTRRVKR